MSSMFANVQPAVKKETKKVAIGTFICVALMWAVFGIGHAVMPYSDLGRTDRRDRGSAEFFPDGNDRTEGGFHGRR